ncbi:hypothetical protein LEP1GSC053_0192 [Leptospira interrogans serovar Muenchen str. Brem 129]|nr:hypothetical protein LEP1GSC053_0192 [Leptospira interrogans serovar Muenchen str. Brem 129]
MLKLLDEKIRLEVVEIFGVVKRHRKMEIISNRKQLLNEIEKLR